MPWPALIGPALSVAGSLFGRRKRGRAPQPAPSPPVLAPSLPTLVGRAVGAVARAGLPPGRRRRARRGLTMREMEKIAMLKAIGAPPAAIMMALMRSMGGRL